MLSTNYKEFKFLMKLKFKKLNKNSNLILKLQYDFRLQGIIVSPDSAS